MKIKLQQPFTFEGGKELFYYYMDLLGTRQMYGCLAVF